MWCFVANSLTGMRGRILRVGGGHAVVEARLSGRASGRCHKLLVVDAYVDAICDRAAGGAGGWRLCAVAA
ncbi:hypothetical protein GCM10010407_01830 [Rarobacter incanus]